MGQHEHGDGDTPASATMTVAVQIADATDASAAPVEGADDPESPCSSNETTGRSEQTPPRARAVPLKLLILVTVVNLGLVLALFALRPPWRVERITAPPAMPAQVAALTAQIENGEHGAPYRLVLTDDDLTATVGNLLAQSKDVPFSQVRVRVVGGKVEATGVTTGLSVAVPVRVQANVVARDGAPVVQVTDVGIGGMPLPSFAHEQVLREANRAVDLSRYDVPVNVDAIELRDGVLEARGTVK